MNLFEQEYKPLRNLLPYDGIVEYYGKIMPESSAHEYYTNLLHTIPFQNDKAYIYGKTIITKRKVAWYGEEPFGYTYSNTTKYALPLTQELEHLKKMCQQKSGERFNSCLLNLYPSGSVGMAWHSDAEKDLVKNGAIASLSFGAERRFLLKHKVSGQQITLELEHGSLLVMRGTTQTHWMHRLPPTRRITAPRLNLTFRTIRNHELT